MTDVFGPFDGITWTQDAWYRHAPKWTASGVNGTPASSTTTGDLPITFSGLNFTIGLGRALVRGAGFERTTPLPAATAIAPNTNASLFRRDRVVLRRDLAAKTVAPTLILGTASASPTAPAIQQNETGQWDSPLYSFLTPPNSGTTITGIVDERGWLPGGSGDVAFLTTAARDAHFPSPTDGASCVVAGGPQIVRSGAWVPITPAYGVATVTTDASGLAVINHGMAAAPSMVQMTPVFTTDTISEVFRPTVGAISSTQIQLVAYRTDSSARLLNTSVKLSWTAWP